MRKPVWLFDDDGILRSVWVAAIVLAGAAALIGVLSHVFDKRYQERFADCVAHSKMDRFECDAWAHGRSCR